MTPQELGDRYVEACLTVGRTVVAMNTKHMDGRRFGLSEWQVAEHLINGAHGSELGDWSASNSELVRRALDDLAAPAAQVLEHPMGIFGQDAHRRSSFADTDEGRRMLVDTERLARRIGLIEVDAPVAGVLEAIAERSFSLESPTYLPKRIVQDDDLIVALGHLADDADEIAGIVRHSVRWLHEKGLIVAYCIDSCKSRITMAGIIWLRDHERVTMDEARRQERVQVNIDNQNGTIYAISTGSGSIHQVIAAPVQPGDWESLVAALAAVQVPQSRIDDLGVQLSEFPQPPGFLQRWAEGSIAEMVGSLGAMMMLAAGSEGVQMLMHLVNTYRS